VWAAGTGGLVIHWNGTSWTQSNAGTSADLLTITEAGNGHCWTAGANGVVIELVP
jgi:hypothetical protein